MRTKKGFKLRTVCGEHIIVAEGMNNIDFSHIISLNDSAAYLWTAIENKDFTADHLAEMLIKEYEVDPKTAKADVEKLVGKWLEIGIIEA